LCGLALQRLPLAAVALHCAGAAFECLTHPLSQCYGISLIRGGRCNPTAGLRAFSSQFDRCDRWGPKRGPHPLGRQRRLRAASVGKVGH
jgi:hypothetical protein